MVTSARSVARKATAVAAAALGVTSPLMVAGASARADSISGIFLYRSFDSSVLANCTGGNRELRNIGNVNLGEYYIFESSYLGNSSQGNFAYSSWLEIASTNADKQLWCYNNDFYYQYYANNAFNRKATTQWYCWGGGCQYYTTTYTPWEPGL
jgi:hypothetical protein